MQPILAQILGTPSGTAAASDQLAQQWGQITGQLVFIIIVLMGIAKCTSIMNRPTTNTKCVTGLMLVLCGFVGCGIAFILSKVLPLGTVRLIVMGLGSIIFMVCVVAAIVFAILGLTELSERPADFTQGRAQAIWSLVLCAIFGLIFISGAVSGFVKNRPLTKPTMLGQVETFPDLNFRYHMPDRPWVTFNSTNFNKDSKFGLMRSAPQTYFMIIAENLGNEDFTTPELVNFAKASIESHADSARVLSQHPYTIRGMKGTLVETEAQLKGATFFYHNWYFATNGYSYQLLGYGNVSEKLRIAPELDNVFQGFEITDLSKVAATSRSFKTNFISAKYNYIAVMSQSGWEPFKTLAQNAPGAEFGAHRGESYMVVIPVALNGQKLDMECLTAGLFAMLNVTFPNEQLTNRREYKPEGMEGIQYDFERDVSKVRCHYRLGVARNETTAYLIAVWTTRAGAAAESIFDDAFSRVRFQVPKTLLTQTPQYTSAERKAQANVLNWAGLHHFNNGEYEEALPLFQAAAKINDSEKIYVVNALKTWTHVQQPKQALEFIDKSPASFQKLQSVRAYKAYFQSEAGMVDAALTNYHAVFQEGYKEESQFDYYIKLLNTAGRYKDSLAAIDAQAVMHDSQGLRLMKAEVYRLQSDFPKAIALLKTEHDKAPFNQDVSAELAESYLAGAQYNDSLDVSREMLKVKRDSAYALYLKGRSELGLKWYRESKTSFEAAVKLAPANKLMNNYLEHVSALMGEGSSVSVKDSIDAVPIPAAWTNEMAAAPADYGTNYGAFYNRRISAIFWDSKEQRSTDYLHLKVLDSSGVSAFSTLQETFDPMSEELFVNEVRVTDANGKVVSTGKLSDYYVLDERPGEMATHRKVLNIPISGLAPGCSMSATITRRQLGKLTEFPFIEQSFSRVYPCRESIVLLSGDTQNLKYRTSQKMEPEKLPEGLCWRVIDPLLWRYEPLQPPLSTYAPMIWIADAAGDWTTLATNYLHSIEDKLQPDSTITETAKKITTGLDSNEAKIAALSAYVQTNCVYKAIEFGRRARIPNKAGEVLANKYGDCKDHAVLLRQMLLACGIPADLALVRTAAPVRRDLPSMDQFDHMIVHVTGTPGKFIDLTDKGGDPTSGFPNVGGDDALVLSEKNQHVETIPIAPAEQCTLELDEHMSVVNGDTLKVDEVFTSRGVYGSYLREYYQLVSASTRASVFQQQLGLADVEVSNFSMEGLDAPAKPLQVRFTYTTKKQVRQSQGALQVSIRAPIERLYLVPAPVEKRLTPFEVKLPLVVRSTISMDVPDSYTAVAPDESNPELNAKYGTCVCKWDVSNRALRGAFECREATGKFPASDYAAYRESMTHVLSLLERDLTFEPMKTAKRNDGSAQ